MPKKKPLEVSKEFIEQVLALIAAESDEERRQLVSILKRAANKYKGPVTSWVTGWFYQFTRTRGEEIAQSIEIIKQFPEAHIRLHEFNLLISKGEWNVGSYNYYLFLELIHAIPDYEVLNEPLLHLFILDLKNQIIQQINSFIRAYKTAAEEAKMRKLERQALCRREEQFDEQILIVSNLALAKESLSKDKIIFSLNRNQEQWKLEWIGSHDTAYSLSLGEELSQKLAGVRDLKQIPQVHLRKIKKECMNARAQYLSKIQLKINPTEELKDLISTFVLNEGTLIWVNSLGRANKLALKEYPKLNSWLSTHKLPFNEEELLELKAHLLQINISNSFSTAQLQEMNGLLSKVFSKKQEEVRGATLKTPNKLTPERYTALAKLPVFWCQKISEELGKEIPDYSSITERGRQTCT